jgi:DNA-binding transcriptional LysR family regulator
MPDIDWNDLRYVLAVARTRSHAAAARALHIDPTTVGRRLRAIEAILEARLVERDATGDLRPTQAGEIAVQRAEQIEAEVGGLTAAVKGVDTLASGTVRVTAVPILVNKFLIPAVGALVAKHPGLRVELIADARGLSLTRGEADIALRLTRPEPEVGAHVLARCIGKLSYAAYAARDDAAAAETLPWLTYEDGMAHLPQARWTAKAALKEGGFAAISVNDADTLVQAVQAGLGRALLPCLIADRVEGIARVAVNGPALPEREIWLLTHPDLRPLARVAAVLAWIDAIFQGRDY